MSPLHSVQALQADAEGALSGAQEALQQAATADGSRADELRERGLAKLRAAREKLAEARDTALDRGRSTARAADELVHGNPWPVVAGAVALGVLAGLLLQRRR